MENPLVPLIGAGPLLTTRPRAPVALLLVLLGVMLVSLAACAAPRSAVSPPAMPRPTTSSAGGLYVAVGASESGKPVAWLATSPILLWFEPSNRVRTAILDAPVNTYNVPTVSDGGVLWTGKESSGSSAGCGRGCEADGFITALVGAKARYTDSQGQLTITTDRRSIVFAPTVAPAPADSSCNLTSSDSMPCRQFVSVSGTEGRVVLRWLRSAPLSAVITGTGALRTIRVSDGTWNLTAPLHVNGDIGVTTAGTAKVPARCSAVESVCEHQSFLKHLFAGTVTYTVHAASLLLTSQGRTIQLQAR